MFYPVYAVSNLVVGVILVLAPLFAFCKIYTGSKSKFAYTLMGFTACFGVQYIAYYFIDAYPQRLSMSTSRTHVNRNIEVNLAFDFVYVCLSVQASVFACKYMESVLTSAVTKPFFTYKLLRVLFILLNSIYLTTMALLYVCLFIQLPSMSNSDYLDWYNRTHIIWSIIDTLWLILGLINTTVTITAIYRL